MAMNALASLLERTAATSQFSPEVFELYRRAARARLAKAALNLFRLFFHGQPVPASEAFALLTSAAEDQDPEAQVVLGRALVEGQRCKADPEAGLAWLLKAAEQGNPEGQLRLGLLYAGGTNGIARDLEESYRWYTAAAGQGHPRAKESLKILADAMGK
eukprot:gnl/TRDRNA2_/TRDRNA2_145472_c0_seq1.p1 gnl/TRDRNA2_/TRDRNA2_145472_c0~~gnl/TRDRNA2_/TRDRNA2_145472_c0_seq1.p1  ORF type:complete len:159 (+),score=40.20 gnl/TRDRNA2_/TRDRNA2_145472_c0_seq1:392-868(+)